MESELERVIKRRCDAAGYGWVVSEDWRHGPQSPPLVLRPDGTHKPSSQQEARWFSACSFTLPEKEIVAVTDEVHGHDDAREAVLRQLLSRLDRAVPL